MLGNLTVAALYLSSLSSASSFLQASTISKPLQFHLDSSSFSHFLNPFFASYKSQISAQFSRSTMTHFLNSAIRIGELQLYRYDITDNHTNYSPAANLSVNEMKFFDCKAEYDGGAIFVISDTFFVCNFTVFSNCSANNKGGAIFSIVPQINFTQGCFSGCSARIGTAVYAPNSDYNFTFEGCFIDYSEGSNSDLVIYADAPDIISSSNNITSVVLSGSVLFLQTTHFLGLTHLTLQNNTASQAILILSQAQKVDEINESNLIGCNAPILIKIDQFDVVISNFHFVDSNCDNYFELSDGSTLTLTGCFFDKEESKVPASATKVDCKFNSKEDPIDLEYVITKGCWAHSYYTWSPPKLAVQVVVGVVIAGCLIGAFIIVIIHAFCKRKKEADNNELIINAA
ncbi:hypothetical protein TRFO_25235 [Tritrichomonas foetus]|uniref:Uncharacterized protein n=1 Tax=Tritrichomonas foetus TaxID=1144522 RepID=A0A1J4K6W0_9EUKA|nr:hypothetical protein TRFO_25235 [Tritrichomonas foetus]|eukprot:OHT06632.1 hypothetical protein TRFO_25235 [Tritrichomonas foetus]